MSSLPVIGAGANGQRACGLALTVEGARQVERSMFRRVDSFAVMRAAGAKVAAHAAAFLARGGEAIALAGPGNNGGDALVAASELKRGGAKVGVAMLGDPASSTGDAAKAIAEWVGAGGAIARDLPALAGRALIVDGLFGIGLSRDLEGAAREWVRQMNASGSPVLAVDAPSGLDAMRGRILGAAPRAAATVTFFGCKPGLLMGDGPDRCGEIIVENLEMLEEDVPAGPEAGKTLTGLPDPGRYRRRSSSNKSTHGTVQVIGGAPGMVGALAMATRAAALLGAGKVKASVPEGAPPAFDPEMPEVMWGRLSAADGADCIAVGPGLGAGEAAARAVRFAAQAPIPAVFDADALNVLAQSGDLAGAIRGREAASLLTPHPGEAGRLLGAPTADIEGDRIGSALRIAERYRAHVALKGAGTVCAAPSGEWRINRSGNAGLASGGSGDVLTGMAASLAAQSGDAPQALLDAVWLHGRAAELLAREGGGMRAAMPSRLARAAAAALDALPAPG